MSIETVKIKADNEQGFIIINKSDLKPEQTLFDKPAQSKKKAQKKSKK